MLISRLPPPKSTIQRGAASGPKAASTASRPRRDSSAALITSRRTPDFRLIARTNASRFSASRVALVATDRKSTRLNSSHGYISYAVFCLKKKKKKIRPTTHVISFLNLTEVYLQSYTPSNLQLFVPSPASY